MSDVEEVPHGRSEAITAGREAVSRIAAVEDALLTGGGAGRLWGTLSEALFWIAAVDEDCMRASPTDQSYWNDRAAVSGGRAVGGLVYARNMHAHQLVATAEAEFKAHAPTLGLPEESIEDVRRRVGRPEGSVGGTIFSVQLRWIDAVSAASISRGTEKWGRDRMYASQVAGRRLVDPINEALGWLDAR